MNYYLCGKYKDMRIVVFLLMLSLFTLPAAAQSKEAKAADGFFVAGDYLNAIDMYTTAIDKEADGGTRAVYKYRIAESYYRLNRLDRAEKNIKDALKLGYKNADAHLLLGDVQLKQGKPDDALASYEAYRIANPGDRSVAPKIASVQFAKDNKQNLSLYKIEPLTKVNSRQNDFGVSYFNNSLLFSTTRSLYVGEEESEEVPTNEFGDRTIPEKKSKKKAFNRGFNTTSVMLSVGTGSTYARPVEIEEVNKMKDFASDGVMIYDPYSRLAYFTRQEKSKTFIYSMQVVQNKWKKKDKIEVHAKGEPIGHPFVAPDGNRIYFTSTMPGGKGKSDIWYINRSGNSWNPSPINLDEINTEGNEVYPYIADGYFFFASDGRIGMGGMDLYVSRITDRGFDTPINLGAPFNSSADDYNLAVRVDGREGVLVSSRGGRTGDDIYRFEGFPSNLKVVGNIRDRKTGSPVSNVAVEVFADSKSTCKVFSDMNGDFAAPVRPSVAYNLVASVPGYASDEKTFTSPRELFARIGKESGVDLDFELQANSAVISGKVYDIMTQIPLEGAVVSLISGGKIHQTVTLGSTGIYKFADLDNSTEYTVRVDPKNYFIEYRNLLVFSNKQQIEYNKQNGYDMDFAMQRYEPNKEFIIPQLFFQEDKGTLLTESYEQLDKIALLFNQNTHFTILLKGYSDVGYKADEATRLSQFRVNAVKDYLLSKKVSQSQISVAALGRQNPIVRNPRSDEERRLNNRITFTVTKVDPVKEAELLASNFGVPRSNSSGPTASQSSAQRQPSFNASGSSASTPQRQPSFNSSTGSASGFSSGSSSGYRQPNAAKNPDNMPFIVQVSSSSSLDMKDSRFVKIQTMLGMEVKYFLAIDGKYKYYVGGFETLAEAKSVAKQLESIGVEGAWPKNR
jgi:outer membrane protein OmpA-like peptidoglycan-associated protein/tetratricopeptide (TPR) repeat protein